MDMHRTVRQSKDIAQDDGILHTPKFGKLRTNEGRDDRGIDKDAASPRSHGRNDNRRKKCQSIQIAHVLTLF